MEKLYEGKSKVVYSSEEHGTCIIKYKDTATAGNGVKKEDLPGKGKLNAAISSTEWWQAIRFSRESTSVP